jgi:nucleosome assembly protein 1-like 1
LNPNWADEFVAGLAPEIRARVHALQGMQKDYDEVQTKQMEEHKQIVIKYAEKLAPLLEKRKKLIVGELEPTEEEIKKGTPEGMPDTTEADKGRKADTKGVPDFWYTVLSNNDDFAQLITERDEEALKHLTNIICTNNEDPLTGFTIWLSFSENPYFSNTALTKKYNLLCEQGINSTVLESAEGCEINWKEGKNLTVVLKKKKQKAKGRGGAVRTVTKEEPCESFFNFFKPPQTPTDEQDEEEDEDVEELIEADYELGRSLKDSIIPRAVDWYTGKAANEEGGFEVEEGEEDEDDEDDDDDDDDEPRPKKGGKGGKGGAPQQQECKQQ